MDRGDLPETVLHADGLKEPFEPERITRSLFTAAEQLGSADAFLARELTEGVLHFLTGDHDGPETTSTQIAEIVVKIVRELGHPELARAFESRGESRRIKSLPNREPQRPPWPDWLDAMASTFEITRFAASSPLEEFSLKHVYPPELVSAHLEGLLRLTNLACPLELAGVAWHVSHDSILNSVGEARQITGTFLAIDAPEFELATMSGSPETVAERYIRELRHAMMATGILPILNLNPRTPPTRVAEAPTPLFEGRENTDTARRREIATALAIQAEACGLAVWWHFSPEAATDSIPATLLDLASAARFIEFVADRPMQAIGLGPGLDRQHTATLEVVGLNLVRLVELMGGAPVEAGKFLGKVSSLSRFAKTAGHVKQDFLRRHGRPGLREAFRLDRARLVLVPIGLAEAAHASEKPAAEFGREIVKSLRSAAETDRPRVLPVCIDSPLGGWGDLALGDPDANLARQIRAASLLHAAAGAGRLDLAAASREEAIRLAAAGSVSRLRFRN